VNRPGTGTLHHVEVWVPDLARAITTWGWLLPALGYTMFQDWPAGRSWRLGHTYIVIEQSPDMHPGEHDRRRPGLNHLAFHVEDRSQVDALVAQAPRHGWRLLFADRHPYAGGPQHYAAYLETTDGFEVELVAINPPST
jgi:catechol 2,3-dioxygenase-like lactoylglutathione lyase family enzyme